MELKKNQKLSFINKFRNKEIGYFEEIWNDEHSKTGDIVVIVYYPPPLNDVRTIINKSQIIDIIK